MPIAKKEKKMLDNTLHKNSKKRRGKTTASISEFILPVLFLINMHMHFSFA